AGSSSADIGRGKISRGAPLVTGQERGEAGIVCGCPPPAARAVARAGGSVERVAKVVPDPDVTVSVVTVPVVTVPAVAVPVPVIAVAVVAGARVVAVVAAPPVPVVPGAVPAGTAQ